MPKTLTASEIADRARAAATAIDRAGWWGGRNHPYQPGRLCAVQALGRACDNDTYRDREAYWQVQHAFQSWLGLDGGDDGIPSWNDVHDHEFVCRMLRKFADEVEL